MKLRFPIRSLDVTYFCQDSTKDLVGTLCLSISPWVVGCAFSVNHYEGAKKFRDDLVDEMCALVGHYLNRTTKSSDDVLLNEFGSATSIDLPNCSSFSPLSHVVSGYNDISGLATSGNKFYRSNIVQPPFLKGSLR